MKRILIVDSNKASLVMISEFFKDKFPGIQIFTAQTLEVIKNSIHKMKDFDLFVLDLELLKQQDIQFVLDLSKNFQKLIIFTSICECPQFHYFFNKLKNKKNGFAFLKKPLHSNVLDAICRYYYNEKKEIVTSALDVEIMGFATLISNKKNTLKDQNIFQIFLQECSLTGVKIQLNLEKDNTQLKQSSIFFKEGEKLKIFLPDLFYISIKQVARDFNKVHGLSREKVEESFKFIIEGKITQSQDIQNQGIQSRDIKNQSIQSQCIENFSAISIWVELNNILFAKQLFEAVERSKTPYLTQSLGQLYY